MQNVLYFHLFRNPQAELGVRFFLFLFFFYPFTFAPFFYPFTFTTFPSFNSLRAHTVQKQHIPGLLSIFNIADISKETRSTQIPIAVFPVSALENTALIPVCCIRFAKRRKRNSPLLHAFCTCQIAPISFNPCVLILAQ